MIHELKIIPEYFEKIITGEKTFEVRKDDRCFMTGDLLALNEYDGNNYTGKCCIVYIDYILSESDYCKEGYIIMSIKPCAVYKYETPFDPNRGRENYSVPLITREINKRCNK